MLWIFGVYLGLFILPFPSLTSSFVQSCQFSRGVSNKRHGEGQGPESLQLSTSVPKCWCRTPTLCPTTRYRAQRRGCPTHNHRVVCTHISELYTHFALLGRSYFDFSPKEAQFYRVWLLTWTPKGTYAPAPRDGNGLVSSGRHDLTGGEYWRIWPGLFLKNFERRRFLCGVVCLSPGLV